MVVQAISVKECQRADPIKGTTLEKLSKSTD